MLRLSRGCALAAALLLAGVVAGCGGSKAAPTTTPSIPTLPKKTTPSGW